MRTRSAGDLIAGKFRLERHLARGGMGEVWAARNLQLDVPVALKLMSAHAIASADLVARFEREAKAAARLRHANVVTIHENGVFEGVPFIAMELLEGEDLSSRLKARGRLSYAEAWPVVNAVCKALRRAHEMSIVHRDLKPANVFLARQDEDEIVKVLDFGIAKILHGVQGAVSTKAGTFLGSAYYMAPEQAGSGVGKVDHRADLWALGVIAFRMLTGKLPFGADAPMDVIMRICTEPAPRASSIAPDLDAATDAFFERALGRHPDARFQSAKEMADAFSTLGERLSMTPPSAPQPAAPSPARDGAACAIPAPAGMPSPVPLPAPGGVAPAGAPPGTRANGGIEPAPPPRLIIASGQPPAPVALLSAPPGMPEPAPPAGAGGRPPARLAESAPMLPPGAEDLPLSGAAPTHVSAIVVGAVLAALLTVAVVLWTLVVAAAP